jgi:hypothetical protein
VKGAQFSVPGAGPFGKDSQDPALAENLLGKGKGLPVSLAPGDGKSSEGEEKSGKQGVREEFRLGGKARLPGNGVSQKGNIEQGEVVRGHDHPSGGRKMFLSCNGHGEEAPEDPSGQNAEGSVKKGGPDRPWRRDYR